MLSPFCINFLPPNCKAPSVIFPPLPRLYSSSPPSKILLPLRQGKFLAEGGEMTQEYRTHSVCAVFSFIKCWNNFCAAEWERKRGRWPKFDFPRGPWWSHKCVNLIWLGNFTCDVWQCGMYSRQIEKIILLVKFNTAIRKTSLLQHFWKRLNIKYGMQSCT